MPKSLTPYQGPNDSTVSALAAASALAGTELVPVVQGGATVKATAQAIANLASGSGGLTTLVMSANDPVSTTAGEAVPGMSTSLAPGTYQVKGLIAWQSAATTTGAAYWVNCSGGTVTLNVGHTYTTTTGTTATSGVADQATVAGTFQLIEARAWRANNTNPGAFGGVDTANSPQLLVLECLIVVTATTTFTLMHASEVAASAITTMAGSTVELKKVA